MIIEFEEQYFNLLMVGAIKKVNAVNTDTNKDVYCIAVFSGNMQIMCEFAYDTKEEQEKAFKKLSKKIRKATLTKQNFNS